MPELDIRCRNCDWWSEDPSCDYIGYCSRWDCQKDCDDCCNERENEIKESLKDVKPNLCDFCDRNFCEGKSSFKEFCDYFDGDYDKYDEACLKALNEVLYGYDYEDEEDSDDERDEFAETYFGEDD